MEIGRILSRMPLSAVFVYSGKNRGHKTMGKLLRTYWNCLGSKSPRYVVVTTLVGF